MLHCMLYVWLVLAQPFLAGTNVAQNPEALHIQLSTKVHCLKVLKSAFSEAQQEMLRRLFDLGQPGVVDLVLAFASHNAQVLKKLVF